MAQFYKILKADPLGDPWTPNFPDAKPLQRFWCQVEGEDWNVSINKQVPGTVTPGEFVYGDLAKTTSAKGNNYWTFKSAKVPDGVQRPASSPAQATAQAATGVVGGQIPGWAVPLYNMVTEMHKVITGNDFDEPATATEAQAKESKGVEVLAGEVDEETQTTLDGIFGDTPIPEDK